MFEDELKIAYEKSDELIGELDFPEDEMISSTDVIDHIKEKLGIEIDVLFHSFEKLDVDSCYGAMMLIEFASDEDREACRPSRAKIVLNGDTDAVFQRFSLFHELGHLMTLTKDNLIDTDNYVVSTHIDYNVTRIPPSAYKKNGYLLKEQIANIFALRVLMPRNQFYRELKEKNDLDKVASFFGVTNDAVISRMMIGA